MAVKATSGEDYMEDMFGMGEEVEPMETGRSEVIEFFEGCNILVTGGSGFIGKLLLEKLLRCCPKMGKLYMMLRVKKGKSVEERFKEHFDDPLYERLKREQPDYASKVLVIEGDTGKCDLGLTPENRDMIRETTHVVFHGAATVRFDEKLRQAVHINVRGLKLMLQLSKEMKNLKAFVHISTAFSHCISKNIEEKFYPPPMEVDRILGLVDLLDDEQLELLTPKLLGKWPNTYAFSKAMAEEAFRRYSTEIPACIVRPSIVISTWKEPITGWTNNLYGATGVVVGSGIGLLRTLHCKPTNVAEIIPADIVINNIVVAAWDTSKQWSERSILGEEPPIYNCVSSSQKPITWGEFLDLNIVYGIEVPSNLTIWYHVLFLNKHLWVHNLCLVLLHLVPALIADSIIYLLGKKPILWKSYRKIHKFMGVISYFSSQEWYFKNDANQRLYGRLNQVDQKKFDFNLDHLDWHDFLYYHVRGLRLFIIKDPMETVEAGRIYYNRLKYAHYTIVTVTISLFAWMILAFLRFLFSWCFN